MEGEENGITQCIQEIPVTAPPVDNGGPDTQMLTPPWLLSSPYAIMPAIGVRLLSIPVENLWLWTR
jgi:hypothetical protein